MRYLTALFLLCTFHTQLRSQLVEISLEPYVFHDGSIAELDGMTTYHVYAVCTNPMDEVSAIYGDATSPLRLTSTDGFYQNTIGSNVGWTIAPILFNAFPPYEYDSWITLGVMNQDEVTGQPYTVGLQDAFASFETGGDFVVNSEIGGSWFTLFEDTQARAGDDLKILLAQLTVPNGAIIDGIFNIQLFVNGIQSAAEQYEGLFFSSDESAIPGCMDTYATNYHWTYTVDDGSCVYPCDFTLTANAYPSCDSPEGSAELFLDDYQGGWSIEELGGLDLCNEDWCIADFLGENAVTVRSLMYFLKYFGAYDETYNEETDLNGDGATSTADLLMCLSFWGNSILDPESNSVLLEDLPQGTYSFYSIDGAGCTAEVSVEIEQGDPVIAAASIVEAPSCYGFEDGIIQAVELSGGQPPYSYRLFGQGENFQSSPIIENVPAGSHSIEVVDSNGCIGISEEVFLQDPEEFLLTTATAINPPCFGTEGEIMMNWSGGTGSTLFSIDGSNFSFQPLSLPAGNYTIIGQDSEGCLSSNSIDVDLIQPSSIEIEISLLDSVPTGLAEIASTVTGGTPPYTWSWSGPNDFSSSDAEIQGLISGDYVLTVQDFNGCIESIVVLVSTYGCIDPDACNYSDFSSYEISTSCDFSCYGCTDSDALNFDPDATLDNGECTYFTYTCADADVTGWDELETGVYFEDFAEHFFGEETVFESVLHLQAIYQDDESGIPFTVIEWNGLEFDGFPFGLTFEDFPSHLAGDEEYCLVYSGIPQDTGVFVVTIQGTLEVGIFDSVFEINDYSTTFTVTIQSNPNPIEGCLDENAANFLSYANHPDGSCLYAGCMDPNAANYYPIFSISDDSCVYCDNLTSSSCEGDVNGDDFVNISDLLVLLGAFGATCQ